MNSIKLSGITKVYDPGKPYEVVALQGVDAEFECGHSYAIMGASGSGKSTLLNILGGLDRPTKGTYSWGSLRMDAMAPKLLTRVRANNIGFVLQDYGLIDYISVLENCLAPCVFAGKKRSLAKQEATKALKMLGIAELANREVKKLSGGQKQRAAIARAIINRPNLILADEPTGALDSKNANMILQVLLSLVNEASIVILATHDAAAAQRCNHILRIKDGRIIQAS